MPALRTRPSTSGTSKISPVKEKTGKEEKSTSKNIPENQKSIKLEKSTPKNSLKQVITIKSEKSTPTNRKQTQAKSEEKPTKTESKQLFSVIHDHSPIYVITKPEGPVTLPIPEFNGCYICGKITPKKLEECHDKKCTMKFHLNCTQKYTGGGYSFFFQQRNNGIYCPRHHCNRCFVDRNRSRCFNGKMARCVQCPIAWHVDCIPAGCKINKKNEIICPRHRLFPAKSGNHMMHCHDCQKENADLDCIRCLRSFHFSCLKTESPSDTKTELTEEFRNSYICHWCHSFEFVKVGQYANGKLGGNKWYPCKVISNEDYPYKDPNLGTVGYVAVQWLPYRNKLFYNVMPHNRVIEMYEKDYFYVLDASKSHCEEEWDEAQEHVIANCPQNFPPKDDQVVFGYSNGHKVSMISKNIFTEKETQFDSDDFREALTECTCKEDDAERCGPKSGCINRALFSECPENCGQKNGVCLNHEVSNHQQKKVEIFRTSDRGFGIKAKEPIPKGTFIGEYIGEVITEKEKNRRLEDIGRWGNIEAQFYILMFDKKRYIDAQFKGNEMRYVNHSCEPNADVRQIRCKRSFHMCLYSLRDINIDEEITFDYKMGKFLEDIPLPICRCKAETCEGVMCGTKYKRPKKSEIREEPSTSTASLQQDQKSGHQKSQKEKIRKKKKLNSSKEMNKMVKKKSIKKNGKSSTNKENILLQLEPLQNIISKKINRRRKSDEMASLKVEFPLDVLSSIPVSSNGNSPRLEVISVKSDLTPEPAKMTPRKITTPKNTPLKDYNFRNRSCLEKEILDSPEISPMPMKISSSRLGASAALIGEEFKVPKKKGRSRRIETSQKENLEPPSKRYNFRSSSSLEVEI